MAISHAQRILSWQENLLSDEMPPEWMWILPDDLEKWFKKVEKKRKKKYGQDDEEDLDDSNSFQNEFTKGLRGGLDGE